MSYGAGLFIQKQKSICKNCFSNERFGHQTHYI